MEAATDFLRLILETANSNRAPQPPSPTNYDPYQLLGLPQNATIQQVTQRYRQLAKIYHPDKAGGYGKGMALLNEAYEKIRREKS